MTGVEGRYHGKHLRVFRLDRSVIAHRLRRAAEQLLAEPDDVPDLRLFQSLACENAARGSDGDIL